MCASLLLTRDRSFQDAAQHTLALERSLVHATSGLRELRAAISGQFGSHASPGQPEILALQNALEEGEKESAEESEELGVRREERTRMISGGGGALVHEGGSVRRAERFDWAAAMLKRSNEEVGDEGWDGPHSVDQHVSSVSSREPVAGGSERDRVISDPEREGGNQRQGGADREGADRGWEDEQLESIIVGALEASPCHNKLFQIPANHSVLCGYRTPDVHCPRCRHELIPVAVLPSQMSPVN